MNPLRQYLEAVLRDAGRVELRQKIEGGSMRSGIFDDLNVIEETIVAIASVGTVYMTLNAPKLMTASNTMTGTALVDNDIGHIVKLPFDFDPVRPKGANASGAEVAAALEQRDRFVASMRAEGWPMPLLGMSGNGAHAVYRCRLPASLDLKEMLACIYTRLKLDYSDDTVDFDTTVRNPSRIWRIYGTVNRKSLAQPGRPQRLATCRIPDSWECLSPKALVRFANQCSKRSATSTPARVHSPIGRLASGKGDYRTLDAVSWFAVHGCYKRALAGGKHAVICPWSHEHSDPDAALAPLGTDTVIFEPSRTDLFPSFFCSHAHCEGRNILDVIALWGDADRHCLREYQGVKSWA